MSELLGALLSYPTAIFTALLGLAVLYWLSVIVGALDIDMFDGEGALDAATAKGEALDGLAAKGEALEGALGDGDIDVEGGGASGLLSAFNLRRAPITVVFSLIVFFGWVLSYTAMQYVAPALPLPSWLVGTLVLVGATVIAMPMTSLATRPLEPIFKRKGGKSRVDYVGTVCRIQTGRVDDGFGQARIVDGGSELTIQVRGDGGTLGRGDRALIVEYDAEREAYIVEAYDELLKEEAASEIRK